MTTVPTTPISMSDINSAFGIGNSIGSYYSARWYKENNSRGYFAASGPISFSDFAGTRSTSPVTAGYRIYNSSQNIDPMPLFNNLTVTVKGGNGGTHGVPGDCNGGGDGGAGGSTILDGYVSAAGGSPNGGTGATNYAYLSITDANQSSIISRYGTQPYGTVGGGGGGGSTGYNNRTVTVCYSSGWNGVAWVCFGAYSYNVCDVATGGGSGGAPGYIRLDWS